MTKTDRLRIVTQAYGNGPSEEKQCGNCCNCQRSDFNLSKRICIAFGDVEGVDCSWDIYGRACGLYNRPFLGLRPVRRPLVELYGPKTPIDGNGKDPDQLSL